MSDVQEPHIDEQPSEAGDRLDWLRETIARVGWAIRHVQAGDLPGEARFSYTIGLTGFGHEEIVITGMPFPAAEQFLNLVAEEVRDGGRFLAGAFTVELTDEDAPIAFIDVNDTHDLTGVAEVYGDVVALQLVWCDSSGRLPWQPGYKNVPTTQPLLGEVPRPLREDLDRRLRE